MQLLPSAKLNRMDICGQLVSLSETFSGQPGGKSREKFWNSRQAIEKQAIISRPECPKMGILWAILPSAKVHDIWCKRGTKVRENPCIDGTWN
jgi:hypothetical protein